MVWCTVLFFEHLDCNKRLQNEREEEWFHLGGGRSKRHHIIVTHHHHLSLITYYIMLQCLAYPISNHQNTSNRDHHTLQREECGLAIHHVIVMHHSSVHTYLALSAFSVSATFHACFTFRPNRPGRIYSEHWVT